MHAYWNGMFKNPDKWIKHSILGPMDPIVMFHRHQEEVKAIIARGGNHKTPMHEATRSYIEVWRISQGYYLGEWNNKGVITLNEEVAEMQKSYLENKWWE
jgi:hypothetical protein